MSITVQQAALHLLPYIGTTSLTPQPVGSMLENVTNGDLDAVAVALTQALQEIHQMQPLANMEKSTGAYLYAPTSVTLTATLGSKTISALTTYAAWMLGCTIRISGDDQDNEIASSTELARPYMGATGSSKTAVVYCDALTLDANHQRAIGPIFFPNQPPIEIVDTLDDFIRLAGYPGITGLNGRAYSWPYFYYTRKSTGRPCVAVGVGAYDSSLAHVPRRLKFAPMPEQAYPVGYRVAVNAPRFTRADIVSPLTSLTATGASSDTNVNQNYTYLCDVAGYRYFKGATSGAYSIFFHPTLGTYIIAATLAAGSTPAAYWESDLGTSPLGDFSIAGDATGPVTVTTSDTGGGTADPGTLIPIVDEAVESVFFPMALQAFTGSPCFKNESAKPEILRAYQTARSKLLNSRVTSATIRDPYTN